MTTDLYRKKRRRRLRMFYVLILVTFLIATNMFGSVPNNVLSMGVREALIVVLPAEFASDLNQQLEKYELPTLSTPAEITEEFVDPSVGLAGAIEPSPTVAFTSVPTGTPIPIPPTRASTIAPLPTRIVFKESQVSMARQWDLSWYDSVDPNKYYTDTLVIEKQGNAYVVTSLTSADGSVKLLDQSWDVDKLTWKYNVDRGDGKITVVSAKTIEINVCGCGGLGYLLDINITTGINGFAGKEPVYKTSMWGETELVPNADYSGNWKQVWHDDAGNKSFSHFTIEKQGDGYVVTSAQDTQGNDAPITSQSWDGKVLEWKYKWGDDTVTMKTVGMDKAGILVTSKNISSWGDEFVDTGLFLEP